MSWVHHQKQLCRPDKVIFKFQITGNSNKLKVTATSVKLQSILPKYKGQNVSIEAVLEY